MKFLSLLICGMLLSVTGFAQEQELQTAENSTEIVYILDRPYPVHQIILHTLESGYSTKGGYLELEDGSRWSDQGYVVRPTSFPEWNNNDRVIVIDVPNRPNKHIQKVFYNLENGQAWLVNRKF